MKRGIKNRIFICCFIIGIGLLVAFSLTSYNDSIPCRAPIDTNNLTTNSVSLNSDTNETYSISEIISSFTLIINEINNLISSHNNHLTLFTIIIGTIGLIIAFVGIMGFREFKNDIKNYQTKVDSAFKEHGESVNTKIMSFENTINEYKTKVDSAFKEHGENVNTKITSFEDTVNKYKTDVNSLIVKIQETQKNQDYHYQCMQRVNSQFLLITNSISELSNPNHEIKPKPVKYHQTQISLRSSLITILLYSPNELDDSNNSIVAEFQNLRVGGSNEFIDDLQFIADNDPNKQKRDNALVTIGFIRDREMNNSTL